MRKTVARLDAGPRHCRCLASSTSERERPRRIRWLHREACRRGFGRFSQCPLHEGVAEESSGTDEDSSHQIKPEKRVRAPREELSSDEVAGILENCGCLPRARPILARGESPRSLKSARPRKDKGHTMPLMIRLNTIASTDKPANASLKCPILSWSRS